MDANPEDKLSEAHLAELDEETARHQKELEAEVGAVAEETGSSTRAPRRRAAKKKATAALEGADSSTDAEEEPCLDTESEADEERVYRVEAILDVRTKRRQKEYLIKWEGYPSSDNSWEAAKNISAKLVAEFEAGREAASEGQENATPNLEQAKGKAQAKGHQDRLATELDDLLESGEEEETTAPPKQQRESAQRRAARGSRRQAQLMEDIDDILDSD